MFFDCNPYLRSKKVMNEIMVTERTMLYRDRIDKSNPIATRITNETQYGTTKKKNTLKSNCIKRLLLRKTFFRTYFKMYFQIK